jgi:hypothetical protein
MICGLQVVNSTCILYVGWVVTKGYEWAMRYEHFI